MARIDIPQEFKRRAQAALPGRVDRLVLFGSRARGDATAQSDWDMAVFLKGGADSDDLCALADAAYELILETGEFIQPVAFSADQPVSDLAILRHIDRQGVAV
ncbi:MAG: nucleotidyltransferase domain-containing protein [Rhodospirillales bacterium]|jgi:predicted nucleotidyltransferase|nr:nucleotidyltransferase domain-containing protein [Rhodospirillales bacterium]MDK9720917.1 nucleotidyltransferase domain-containing protein [Rhodospirillales bacterium]